jgi:hypothetical protein
MSEVTREQAEAFMETLTDMWAGEMKSDAVKATERVLSDQAKGLARYFGCTPGCKGGKGGGHGEGACKCNLIQWTAEEQAQIDAVKDLL